MKKIIVLHGWTYSFDKWLEFQAKVANYGISVSMPEIPGLTEKSEKVWDIKKYSEWLEKKIGKAKVVLVGHSNGGRIAAYFTARHPEKVSKLILISTAGIYDKSFSKVLKRFVFKGLSGVGKKITKSQGLKNFLYKLAREEDYKNASDHMKKTMVNLISTDLTKDFQKIEVPTLIIWGGEDTITPISDGLKIQEYIKDSKLEIINGARHSPFYTHPKKVIDAISSFLK